GSFHAFAQLTTERNDFLGDLVGQRHLIRVPSRDGWHSTVRTAHEAFHHANAIQPHWPAGDNENISGLKIADERLLDHPQGAALELNAHDAFIWNDANVLQQIAPHSITSRFERIVAQIDLPKYLRVLL